LIEPFFTVRDLPVEEAVVVPPPRRGLVVFLLDLEELIADKNGDPEIKIEQRDLAEIRTLRTDLADVRAEWDPAMAPEKDRKRALAYGTLAAQAGASHLKMALGRKQGLVDEREFGIQELEER
jgi:hypothetical protein